MKFSHGNRCGFSQDVFRQPEPLANDVKNNLPLFIRQIQEEVRNNGIPGLNLRAERDEAVRALVIELLNHMDLWTGKIGLPTENGWLAFGWDKILKRLPWLSESRLWEALRVLETNGLFSSNQRLIDSRYITKDTSKKSGYAISDKGFTEHFWISFRQLNRWKQEAKAKALRVEEKAVKIGKSLLDFYVKKWSSTSKTSVKQLSATAIQAIGNEQASSLKPSKRALIMQLVVKLITLGVNNASEKAETLFNQFGELAVYNTESYIDIHPK